MSFLAQKQIDNENVVEYVKAEKYEFSIFFLYGIVQK
jgi:hypothetical protein